MATKKKTKASLSDQEKQLRAEYKTLAKRADQRLVRLEKYSEEKPRYSGVLHWSYANAQYEIRSFFGEEATRFNKSLPASLSARQVNARINAVKRFLSSETSTLKPQKEDIEHGIKAIQGIESLYDKRLASFNKTMGTDLTLDEFIEFMNNKYFEKIIKTYQYGVAKKRIGQISKKREKVLADMQASKRPGRINNPKLVMQAIMRELTKNKATVEELEAAKGIMPKQRNTRKIKRK